MVRRYNYETIKIGDDWFERVFQYCDSKTTIALCRDADKATLVMNALNGVETGEIKTVDGDGDEDDPDLEKIRNEDIGSRLREVFHSGE